MVARTRSTKRLRLALFLGVGLAMTGVAFLGYGFHFFDGPESRTVDKRFAIDFRIHGTRSPKDIVVVEIDDDTFSDFNTKGPHVRWPFPRSMFGRVIDRLSADGAKVIAYDVQFTEETTAAEDGALVEATGRAGNVVLATTEVNAKGHSNVFGGDDVVRQFRARVGNSNYPPEDVIRQIPFKTDKLKSFALVAAERATGKTISAAAFGHRTFNWIDYFGPPGTIRSVPFSKVFYGSFRRGMFKGKIVVVGPSAPSLHDVHPTSVGHGQMSGAEIQANAISTALRGFPLRSVSPVVNVALILFLGLLPAVAGLRGRLVWSLVPGISAGLLYLVATQVAFDRGHVISFIYPFGALTLSSVGSLGAHYLMAAFERERVRDVFSRFVPESVVEQVLARTDGDLRLGGVSLVGTVMFTDLRGFTTFSESLPAARVIEALNVYLSEMTEAILEHGGTLVSYEGDGIMAVFGAPIEQEDHADRAVAASREMLLDRLPRWNAWLREQELNEGFRMGIGLNTGSFMSGNVGSERRLEYTAIGDTTNTASRLQGMTKGQAYLLYMADSTRKALMRDVDDAVFIDEFEVRGRQEAVKIWSIEDANSEAFDAREAAASAAEG